LKAAYAPPAIKTEQGPQVKQKSADNPYMKQRPKPRLTILGPLAVALCLAFVPNGACKADVLVCAARSSPTNTKVITTSRCPSGFKTAARLAETSQIGAPYSRKQDFSIAPEPANEFQYIQKFQVLCDDGDTVTGGGYKLPSDTGEYGAGGTSGIDIDASFPIVDTTPQGWEVWAETRRTVSVPLQVFALCSHS
jgi:hypothetical protein